MSFMDKLGSAAALAKWKAEQQVRIVRAQNAVHDLENQVKTQKASLADSVLDLYAQGVLTDPGLQQACAAITQLNVQVAQANEAVRQIQAEQPPSDNPAPAPAPSPTPAPAYAPPPAPVQTFTSPAPTPVADTPAQLVCPECGQVLKGRFCPEHGREGVPAQ